MFTGLTPVRTVLVEPFDHVVLATMRVALDALSNKVHDLVATVRTVGDAFAPRGLREAT